MYRFFQIFSDGELTMEIYLQDSAATEALGKLLGRHAADGDVFCLTGDLGAGKTLLSRGVAEALGVSSEDVTSPTFAIMNVYQGTELEVRHFDLYRLADPEELEFMGIRDYFSQNCICLIEWAEKGEGILPEADLLVNIDYYDDARNITLIAQNSVGEHILTQL